MAGTTIYNGDMVVSRNIHAGGDIKTGGDMTVGHNLKVEGWLDAKNIKCANKGLFRNAETLQRAYPRPLDGWYAGVGTSSFVVYVGERGAWVSTGASLSLTLTEGEIDMPEIGRTFDTIGELRETVAELEENVRRLSNQTGSMTRLFNRMETDARTITVLADGKGSVNGGGMYIIGDTATLSATASEGYHFVQWNDGNTDAVRTVEVSGDAQYTATFAENTVGVADYYVGFFNGTRLEFAGLTKAELLSMSTRYSKEYTPTYTGVAEEWKNTFFIMWRSGSEPKSGEMIGKLTTVFIQSDFTDDAIFGSVHDNVVIDGVTYLVRGIRNDYINTSTKFVLNF